MTAFNSGGRWVACAHLPEVRLGEHGGCIARNFGEACLAVNSLDKSPLPFLIGIAGGTGSGKTTLARAVVDRFASPGAILLDRDSYYLDRSHLSWEERDTINFDEPLALDHELLVRHLAELREGAAIEKPRYSFAIHTRTGKFETAYPTPLIILEDLFALSHPRAQAQMGLKVYLDGDPDLRFIRRLHHCGEPRSVGHAGIICLLLD